jgi:hypothetical protein
MKNRMHTFTVGSIGAMLVLNAVFTAVTGYAHDNRIFVEVDVEDHLEGVETDFAVAMEFINAIDFKGLEAFDLPDNTCVDPEVLRGFIPPPILGNRAYIYTFDINEREAAGPAIWHSPAKGEFADCYAFVYYTREAEDQSNWESIRIWIRDVGIHASQYHRYNVDDDDVEVDTIKGYEALVRRALDEGVGGQGMLGISIEVGTSGLNWSAIVEAAKQGVRNGIAKWSCSAKFTNGSINGSILIIPPGSLEGICFSDAITEEIYAAGAPAQVAVAFAGGVWSGWEHWCSTFSGTFDNAYPAFVSFPGPSAPPTPAIPLAVISANADRDKLTAEGIASKIISLLGEWKEDPEGQKAAKEFARWFDDCFTKVLAKARIENLMGSGPVPTYNPPQVPVGPVEGGEVIKSPVLFSGFEF